MPSLPLAGAQPALVVPSIFPAGARIVEAHAPPLVRDDVRLLVTQRRTDRVVSTRFTHLADYLLPGDLLVVNDSATLPAALQADGVTVHLSTSLSGYGAWLQSRVTRWVVEPRHYQGAPGEVLALRGGGQLTLLTRYLDSQRLWEAELVVPEPLLDWLFTWGRPVRYDYLQTAPGIDAYQTIFSARLGSAEMPSAGRPFTPATLDALTERGVRLAPLTLHTGVASLETHEHPYAEYYDVPWKTAAAVHQTRDRGGRVVAIGTTVVRALESAPCGGRGWTEKIITEQTGVRMFDGLLTGLHEPQATHLAMLAAFATPDQLRVAYARALSESYRWHEFGDLHLIL